jgi:hypothetical protein
MADKPKRQNLCVYLPKRALPALAIIRRHSSTLGQGKTFSAHVIDAVIEYAERMENKKLERKIR